MTTNQDAELPELNDTDADLLSEYIDRRLPTSEQAALEKRLKEDPALAANLYALERTISLVRNLPDLRAPRDFTLSPDDIVSRRIEEGDAASSRRAGTAGGGFDNVTMLPERPSPVWLQAVAALAVVMVGGMLLLTLLPARPTDDTTASIQQESGDAIAQLPTDTAAVEATTTPVAAPTGAAQESALAVEPEAEEDAEEERLDRAPTDIAENQRGVAPEDDETDDTAADAEVAGAEGEGTDDIAADAEVAGAEGEATESAGIMMVSPSEDDDASADAAASGLADIAEAPDTLDLNVDLLIAQMASIAVSVLVLVISLLSVL